MTALAAPDTRRRRLAFAAVTLGALLHALFYAVVDPPWSPLNEPHHLDYVLTLRDTWRIPDIRQPVRADVRQALWVSERWKTFSQKRPETPEAALGRDGTSYEGYQPPLYYVLAVPIAALAGTDPLQALYAIRAVSVLLLPALAGIAWALAARWFPGLGLAVPVGAALSVGALPVMASSCARVTNDGLVALLIGGGLLAVLALLDHPSAGRGAVLGLLVAGAALTKSPGLLLLPVTLLGLGLVWRRGQLSRGILVAALAPWVLGYGAWAAWTYARYGVPDGTWAFILFHRRSPSSAGLISFVQDLWWNAWAAPPVWAYGMRGARGLVVMALLSALVVVGGIGVARRPRPVTALAVTLVLAAGAVTLAFTGSLQGMVPPVGRVLMPAYPALAALTAGGWARLLGPRAAFVPAAVAWGLALFYDLGWFLPLARPWWLTR